jgi:hypothetical protein
MRAIARALTPAIPVDAATFAIVALLAGVAAIGGLSLHALNGVQHHVCSVVLPAHSSAIGAFVEFQERVAGTGCRRGDTLAVSGDVHLPVLARFCDAARAVTLGPAGSDTGRPSGALCSYSGPPHGTRGP